MDVLEKISCLMKQKGWSLNQLAKYSGVPQSTLSGLYQRNNCPTIPTLEKLCMAFDITLSEFFATQEDAPYITSEQRRLLDHWGNLSKEHQEVIWFLLERL